MNIKFLGFVFIIVLTLLNCTKNSTDWIIEESQKIIILEGCVSQNYLGKGILVSDNNLCCFIPYTLSNNKNVLEINVIFKTHEIYTFNLHNQTFEIPFSAKEIENIKFYDRNLKDDNIYEIGEFDSSIEGSYKDYIGKSYIFYKSNRLGNMIEILILMS